MQTNDAKTCPLCRRDMCKHKGLGEHAGTIYSGFDCESCGSFRIAQIAMYSLNERPDPRISAWVREQQARGVKAPWLSEETLETLRHSLPIYSPSQKQIVLLRAIEARTQAPGADVELNPLKDFPLAWAASPSEFVYLIRALGARTYIERADSSDYAKVIITPAGWDKLDETRSAVLVSDQAFVAMSFDKEYDSLWLHGIRPAIAGSGYSPFRVDTVPHTDLIDAKIVAAIRDSKFLVADVTGDNRGVYYEAGFAHGLGLHVFWTVRADRMDAVHFDTNHYNHITWEAPEELAEKLQNAIFAVLGRGPRQSTK